MDTQEIYNFLPGKSARGNLYLPLWMHLEDTAAVMESLCQHRMQGGIWHTCGLNSREEFHRVCVFMAMVHDIGKCTSLFLSQILCRIPQYKEKLLSYGLHILDVKEYLYKDKSYHNRMGEYILCHYGCPDGICSIVGAHHGIPSSQKEKLNSPYRQNVYGTGEQKALWEKLHCEILHRALAKAGYTTVQELPILSQGAQMLISGLVIQADWIASNSAYFPLLSIEEAGNSAMYPQRSEAALQKLSLPDGWTSTYDATASTSLYPQRFGFSPNPMQEAVERMARSLTAPGLVMIEAQMGTGKTEAALVAAEILSATCERSGIFFGLPTQATSNGIFQRLAQWAELLSQNSRHSIRLVHGMAALNEEYQQYCSPRIPLDNVENNSDTGLLAHSWFAGKKQALLADFVVGTVDTALMAALKQRHVMLRHLGLSTKTVIIDECHAYDAYMSKYLEQMLRWLGAYQVPVILLSATLPKQKKEAMLRAYLNNKKAKLHLEEGYPLLTWTANNEAQACPIAENVHQQVKLHPLAEKDLCADLEKHLQTGGCAGIIVNTVKRAQAISEVLRSVFPDKHILLFHAQFLFEDRREREKKLVELIGKHSTSEDRNQVVVVGTQVLEQSLDIDFDYLITDLCPMDLLLQRIGRLHRHHRERPEQLKMPECSVLCMEEMEAGAVSIYGEWLLQQTKRYCPDMLTLPTDIPRLVNCVYAEPTEAEKCNPAWVKFQDRTEIKEDKADTWLLPQPKVKASRRELGNSIAGLLDNSVRDEKAEASVRDTLPSLDVLVLREVDDDHVGFLPWLNQGVLRRDTAPTDEEGKQIALQRLKLPTALCSGQKLEDLVEFLEKENKERLTAWQESPWMQGELVLLLDANCEKDLPAYHIQYKRDIGFTYERQGD